jgi:hypothetical protein
MIDTVPEGRFQRVVAIFDHPSLRLNLSAQPGSPIDDEALYVVIRFIACPCRGQLPDSKSGDQNGDPDSKGS